MKKTSKKKSLKKEKVHRLTAREQEILLKNYHMFLHPGRLNLLNDAQKGFINMIILAEG